MTAKGSRHLLNQLGGEVAVKQRELFLAQLDEYLESQHPKKRQKVSHVPSVSSGDQPGPSQSTELAVANFTRVVTQHQDRAKDEIMEGQGQNTREIIAKQDQNKREILDSIEPVLACREDDKKTINELRVGKEKASNEARSLATMLQEESLKYDKLKKVFDKQKKELVALQVDYDDLKSKRSIRDMLTDATVTTLTKSLEDIVGRLAVIEGAILHGN
jgi:hypothetical protein